MNYFDIPEYTGEKTQCDHCDRSFNSKEGEVITFSKGRGLVFCYSDAGGGCLIAHTMISGDLLEGETMRFRGSALTPPPNPTPNYPSTIINQEKARELRRLRGLLDSW